MDKTQERLLQGDLVDMAEEVVKTLDYVFDRKTNKKAPALNNTQIRKLLTAVMKVKNKVDARKSLEENSSGVLSAELCTEVKRLKAHWAYQIGREKADKDNKGKSYTEDLVIKGKLFECIEGIQTSQAKFYEFCKYMEAIVAFHRYYGGKD
ncbi:type III-A CRISPR-associated protein Csm2 [Colibacter massiliensis]|uniref:type III-A CRISPR-associated protein Csm2 n=1 Tax=Colibacter massiliensis TaxID=1852379 RepID=UPI00266D2804|nr:type III-A CRISPR-associated protein Csm2 [Colibacter massiliensis]